jgi:hypothetical protein
VLFGRGVVNELRARAVEGLHALPKRGAEVGGLLFGRVLRTKPLLARVSGFEDVPCQHCYGPSYVLSDEDRVQLEAALKEQKSDPVIGFFRSYTGREMLLDEADRNLLNRYFADRQVFLLLQPRATGASSAALLFPEGGEVGWEPQYPAFDFDEAGLTGPVAALAAAAIAAPTPAEAGVEAPPAPAPADLPPARPPRRFLSADESVEMLAPPKRRFLLPLVGWIAVCLAAAGVYELWTMARAPRWRPLGLNALMAAGTIHLGWNAALNSVRDAKSGVLTIVDGTAEKRITLAPAQIREGKFDYRPAASDLLFRLELAGSALEAAGDSLRVVAVAPPVAAAPPPKPAAPVESTADHNADRENPEPRPANIAVLPEPLREIHPDIPPGIRARIRDRLVVPVEVQVTASGKVTSAAAHSGANGDGLYHYLADRAAKAARQWRFSPARAKDGRAVPAARTVYFVFRSMEG